MNWSSVMKIRGKYMLLNTRCFAVIYPINTLTRVTHGLRVWQNKGRVLLLDGPNECYFLNRLLCVQRTISKQASVALNHHCVTRITPIPLCYRCLNSIYWNSMEMPLLFLCHNYFCDKTIFKCVIFVMEFWVLSITLDRFKTGFNCIESSIV